MSYVETMDHSGPLCPYSMFGNTDPHAAVHRKATAIHNDVYEEFADRRDADGEMTLENEKAYTEAICQRIAAELDVHVMSPYDFDRMRLYMETAGVPVGRNGYVVAFFFQCQGCGFVLPAQEVPR